MIDLHIHSNCSDGSDDWKSILQKAESIGLSCISITDHDNCDVYTQIETHKQYYSGDIITGIELQAYFKGLNIELLGYGFDVDKMQELVKDLFLPFEVRNQTELHRLHERCIALGMKFAPDVVKKYDVNKQFYATEYLHNEMRKFTENKTLVPDEESWNSESIFFKRHTSNPNSYFYIDESDFTPSAEQIIDTIHKARGKVFIPHIYQYEENSLAILNGLVDNYKVDGIECYYPSFSQTQTEFLIDFCQKCNLLISGGSDYHGSYRSNIGMGIKEKGNLLCTTSSFR